MRKAIRAEVQRIEPLDEKELAVQAEVLAWIDSGAELCRLQKPATPRKHLVSYFALVDGHHILLVDHINAELWLPTGGHVEPGEHPRETAIREAKEELNFVGAYLYDNPLLLTSTETVGKTAGHVDVSFWYVLAGDKQAPLHYDQSEFYEARWFHFDEVPLHRTDPEMSRFLTKLRHHFREHNQFSSGQ